MTLTRQLARALKRIKALEAENVTLKEQLQRYQVLPVIEYSGSTIPLYVNGMPWCNLCQSTYSPKFPHICTPKTTSGQTFFSTDATVTGTALINTFTVVTNEEDWWNRSWTTR